jgi:hypothetical protein
MMAEVDAWVESGRRVLWSLFKKKSVRAKDEGLCFIEACGALCFVLGHPSAFTMDQYAHFMAMNGKEIDAGVNKEEATDFFLMLQNERVRLEYSTLVVQRLSGSSHKIDGLVKQAQRLEAGWYLVAAECDQELQHCFAMLVPDGEKNASSIKIIDGFDAKADTSCVQEALSHLEWLDYVVFIRRVKFLDNSPFAGKRKTKTECAREKRAKLGGSM